MKSISSLCLYHESELAAVGNAELKKGNIAAAGDLYTKAIELDPANAIFYCNRLAAMELLSSEL